MEALPAALACRPQASLAVQPPRWFQGGSTIMKRVIRAVVLASAASLAACAGMGKNEDVDYRAIVASPDRSEADRQTDQRRNPELLLAFTGARPGMRVLDMGAGGGYSTELLARGVGSSGKVYGQDSQAVSPRARERFEERAKTPAMQNVVRVLRDYDDPVPPEGVSVAKSLHRIEEATLRREIEAAGFRLIAEAGFLRHPEDARDAIVFHPKAPVDEF